MKHKIRTKDELPTHAKSYRYPYRDGNILYTLCYIHLKNTLDSMPDRPRSVSKEEGKARLSICNSLYTLAAAAAVRNNMYRDTCRALADLMAEIEKYIEWNACTISMP